MQPSLLRALCGLILIPLPVSAEPPVSFEREVLPILEHRCNDCHHPEDSQGGLDLTRIATMLRGGDEDGPSVVPGEPEKSPLLLRVTGEMKPRMPKKEEELPETEVELLRRWIAEGAHDDTPVFADEDIAFFEKEIRPLLFERCFKCHAGEDPESDLLLSSRHGILLGGNRGPAAVPGEPSESLLLSAVRHEGDLKMPKGGDRLTERQIASLEDWIERGMPWPSNERVLTREKLFTISEADRQHWAFRPLPDSAGTIDELLAKHQASRDLEPAPQADRHRLLRRVSYDLTGFPPTRKEILDFLSDQSPGAYERVVDRLLSSEWFGNRWGRHWLDYTRNGANGQQNRGPDLSADRYARWVEDCFNGDLPYDWFVRVHLAGDLMPGRDGSGYAIDQALAAAVPLNGARTFQNASTETFVLMDKLDEAVEFMGRSLMGISLECARCHDHKFDPVSQRDYYALLGFFQSSWFGPVPTDTASPEAAFEAVEKERDLLRKKARFDGLIRVEATKISVRGGELRRTWKENRQDYLRPWDQRLLELEVAVLEAEQSAARKGGQHQLAADLETAIGERRGKLADFSPRFFDVRSLKEIGYQIRGHKSEVGLIRRARALGLGELAGELEEWAGKFEAEREEWWERHRFGSYRKGDPEVARLSAWDDEVKRIQAELDELRRDRVVVRSEGGLRRAEELEPFAEEARADHRQFYPELVPAYFGDARMLDRGDVLAPRELIPRGFPEFFGGGGIESGDRSSGRLDLARWITREHSLQASLVARAAANRAWQQLFGEALCRSPKELGRLGEVPEMPTLIDAIALRFIRNDWSWKRMIREIVLSRAYRQSSRASDSSFERDPHNRFFARQNVRRLEAEPIVNTMAFFETGEREPSRLPGRSGYRDRFDPPTTDDLIDRRVASISPAQALFLMNNQAGVRRVAREFHDRLGPEESGLSALLDGIYLSLLQRPPSPEERTAATDFVERRRAATGRSEAREEVVEFLHLLLCSNEVIYLE